MAHRISVKEASEMLDMNPESIRRGLRQKELPIGWAVKNNTEYSYYIYKEMIDRCLYGSKSEEVSELLNEIIDYLYRLKNEYTLTQDLQVDG